MVTDPDRILDGLAELHALTLLRRTGWVLAGVADPESVAEHSFETAAIARILAENAGEPADLGRVLTMALFHEAAEARLGDLPRRAGPYAGDMARAEREASRDVLDGVPGGIPGLLDELAEGSTPEARIVQAAHGLQIITAALFYAREQRGDLTEYLRDADRYDPHGIEPAADIARVVRRKLAGYLGDRPHWALGYRRRT